jgi:hypothetical protein
MISTIIERYAIKVTIFGTFEKIKLKPLYNINSLYRIVLTFSQKLYIQTLCIVRLIIILLD